MSVNLKRLIEALIEEEFSQAPQMGDIDPTPEDDKDRPLMDKRPEDGMDVSQHHKMMWAEDVQARNSHDEYSDQERLVDVVMMRLGMGQSIEDIVDGLKDRVSVENIYLAYNAAKMLEGTEAVDEEVLEEMSAIGGGGAGLASSGKVSATSAGSAWKKSNNPEHDLLWSGDDPHGNRPQPGVVKKKSLTESLETLKVPWKVIHPQVVESILTFKGTKEYKAGKPTSVDLKTLLASQEELFKDKKFLIDLGKKKQTKNNLPVVIELPNRLRVIQNGHHRLAGLMFNKHKKGVVHLIKYKEWPNRFAEKYFTTGKVDLDLMFEELIGTSKNGAPSYFQMGSSLPDKLYNQDSKTGKATRDPGVMNMKKESKEEPTGPRSTTFYFKIGDQILFGKYKNKKGKVVGFGKDDKGSPTMDIESISKGKKKKTTMGLYRMWLASVKEKTS